MKDRIFITEPDCTKLRGLIAGRRRGSESDLAYLEMLEEELDRAEIVEAHAIPPDVITMHSEVVLRDLDSGEERTYRLIFPNDPKTENTLSILAPIGTALLGYRVGAVIEWPVPRGMRRFEVLKIGYQPESSQRVS